VLLLEGEVGAEHQGRRAQQREARLHDRPGHHQRRDRCERRTRHERRAPADALHEQRGRIAVAARPTTVSETGSVASSGRGASWLPTMLPSRNTVIMPAAERACASAST